MVNIKFVEANGAEYQVEANAGENLMQAATNELVPGILADCDGCCSCATCHVYIQPEMLVNTGEVSDVESDLLECAYEPDERSRLSCQVVIDSSMDGMVVHIPERQF